MTQYILGRTVEDETTNVDEESYKRNIVCYSVPERSNIGYVDIMYFIWIMLFNAISVAELLRLILIVLFVHGLFTCI